MLNYDESYLFRGKIDGKTVTISLNPGYEFTFCSPSVGRGLHTLAVETAKPFQIHIPLENKLKAEDVSLGYDVLKSGSLGYDQGASQLYYWPNGIGGAKAAEEWVKSATGTVWPKSAGAIQEFLETAASGLPFLKAKVLSRQVNLRISYGLTNTVLKAFPDEASAAIGSARLEAPVDLGETSAGWVIVGKLTTDPNPFAKSPFDGLLGLASYQSQRIIVDFPSKTITYEKYSKEDRLTMLLQEITRCVVAVTQRGLIFGGPNVPPEYQSITGSEMVSLGDFKGKDIFDALQKQDASSVAYLNIFFKAMHNAYVATVKLADGTEQPYPVAADSE